MDSGKCGVIFLSGQTGNLVNNLYGECETDKFDKTWTGTTQDIRPINGHPASDETFLGSWLRRNYVRRFDRCDEHRPIEFLP